jgi:hypothetical protein
VWRQEDGELDASLGYIGRHCLNPLFFPPPKGKKGILFSLGCLSLYMQVVIGVDFRTIIFLQMERMVINASSTLAGRFPHFH